MGKKDARVDAYIARSAPFARPILKRLRRVLHAGCPGLEETIKWGMPAFEYKGPLAGMAAFKAHATFGFWKHALLEKELGAASTASRDAMGQYGRITSVDDLPSERVLLAWTRRAAALNEQGVRVPRRVKPKPVLTAPAYFMGALRDDSRALATYRAFSPSQRREYVEWVTEAKTEATRRRRLETAVGWMAEGKPRNWKYVKR